MTLIGDAASLILLAKVSILEVFAKRNKVVVPRTAYEEIIRGKDKGREDSLLVERLAAEKLLRIVSPSEAKKKEIERLFNLKGGEQEVIALGVGKKEIILTDDKKCMNVAKALKIGFITSLDVVVSLYRKGAINREKSLECISRLEEYGWYSKGLIKTYREMVK